MNLRVEGDKKLDKAYLEIASDLDESNLTITTNLAYLYLADGEFDEAREYLERARFLAKDDKFVKGLIKEYENATGEKIGDIIHEEYVKNTEDTDSGEYPGSSFQEDFRKFALSVEEDLDFDEEDECSCKCGGHCHDEKECGNDGECSCHNKEGHECKCHH